MRKHNNYNKKLKLTVFLLLLCFFVFCLACFGLDIGILAKIDDPVVLKKTIEENEVLIPLLIESSKSRVSFFADLEFYLEFIWRPSPNKSQFYRPINNLSYEIKDLSLCGIDSSRGLAFDTLKLPFLSAEESLIFIENSLNERVFYPELARYLILEINYQNSLVKKILMNDTRLDQNLIDLILNDPAYVHGKCQSDHKYSTGFINEVSKNQYLSIKMSDFFFRTSLIQYHQKYGYLPDTKVIKTCFGVKNLQILASKKEGIYKKL